MGFPEGRRGMALRKKGKNALKNNKVWEIIRGNDMPRDQRQDRQIKMEPDAKRLKEPRHPAKS